MLNFVDLIVIMAKTNGFRGLEPQRSKKGCPKLDFL
jgi:hypothetical protein